MTVIVRQRLARAVIAVVVLMAAALALPNRAADASELGQVSATTTVGGGYDDALNLAVATGVGDGRSRTVERWVADASGFLLASSGGLRAPRAPVASNAADHARLRRQLQFDEAASVFTPSGGLQQSVIDAARPIVPGSQIRNTQAIETLTADGSNIADWAKYTTQSFDSPSGTFQVHLYRNTVSGATNYTLDYKVKFGGGG